MEIARPIGFAMNVRQGEHFENGSFDDSMPKRCRTCGQILWQAYFEQLRNKFRNRFPEYVSKWCTAFKNAVYNVCSFIKTGSAILLKGGSWLWEALKTSISGLNIFFTLPIAAVFVLLFVATYSAIRRSSHCKYLVILIQTALPLSLISLLFLSLFKIHLIWTQHYQTGRIGIRTSEGQSTMLADTTANSETTSHSMLFMSINEIFAPMAAVIAAIALLVSIGSALTTYYKKPENFLLAVQRVFSEVELNEACGTWLGPGKDILFMDADFQMPNLDPQKLLTMIIEDHQDFSLCNATSFKDKMGEKHLQAFFEKESMLMSHISESLAAYSSAYQLARIFQAQPLVNDKSLAASKDKRINIEDPRMEVYNGQFYYPIHDARRHWDLLTSVHTVWDDPADSGFLRAHAPWGTLQCNVLETGKTLCSFQRRDPPGWPEGLCTYFDLWTYNPANKTFELENINEQHWLDNFFALHMQEETIYRIYRYSINLLQANGHKDIYDLGYRVVGRTRETYKTLAIKNFRRYLLDYPYSGWNITDSDIRDKGEIINLFGGCNDTFAAPSIRQSRSAITSTDSNFTENYDGWRIDKQERLELFTQQSRDNLPNDLTRDYQSFIALKLGRLSARAAVFDDRFMTFGFLDRTFWVG